MSSKKQYYVDIAGEFKCSLTVIANSHEDAEEKALKLFDEGNLSTEIIDVNVWGEKELDDE